MKAGMPQTLKAKPRTIRSRMPIMEQGCSCNNHSLCPDAAWWRGAQSMLPFQAGLGNRCDQLNQAEVHSVGCRSHYHRPSSSPRRTNGMKSEEGPPTAHCTAAGRVPDTCLFLVPRHPPCRARSVFQSQILVPAHRKV